MAIHRRLRLGARLPLGAAVALSGLLANVPASAQASLNQAYPEGFALSVFEPAPAGDRFFAVGDAKSFTDKRLRLGLVGDYPTNAVLRRTDNVTGQTGDVVSSQLYLHAGAAYPITDFLHAHVNVPFAAVQKGNTASSPKGGTLGDVRLGLRANVINPATEAVAFGPGVDLWIPTGSENNLTGDGKVRVNPRLGVSGRAGAFVYTANVGYLVRKKVTVAAPAGNPPALELGDAVTFGVGAGVVLFDDVLQIGPELWGNRQVSSKLTGSAVTPVSALFGAKVHIGDFAFGAAAGPGLTDAPGVAPRVVVSIALAPETHVKAEGHVTTDVAAPDHAGVEVTPPAAPKDSDGDGVRDELDACPDVKGEVSGNKTKNACPAPLADKPVQMAETHHATQPGEGADVTVSGFHVFDDGTSRITVELTSTVPVDANVTGRKAEYLLHGARIPIRNNKNPLLTEHFVAVVVSARLIPEGEGRKGRKKHEPTRSDVRLVVEMREAAKPQHRLVRNADGTATLVVDFPKPTKPPAPPTDPVPPVTKGKGE